MSSGHMGSSQMWCFALRVVSLFVGSLPPLAYAACGPTGTEKVVTYSQGTTDTQNPANCTLFNGPPNSLVKAARRRGYEVSGFATLGKATKSTEGRMSITAPTSSSRRLANV